MPNQHTKKGSKPIHRKCAARGCKVSFQTIPCKDQRYCSTTCANKSKTSTKYTDKAISWIIENFGVVSVPAMAKKYKSTIGAFRRALSSMRSAGHPIPKETPRTPHPAGTIVERKRKDGTIRKYQKQADGTWAELLSPLGRGRYRTTGAGDRNKRTIPKPERPEITLQQSLLFIPEALVEKTQLLFPNGRSVICDSDKVEKVLRYLQKMA
jgi:hypothetical protein